MATIDQIKALLRMHFESNDEKFKTVALQIAAHEAKLGHSGSAREIRDIVQNPKYSSKNKVIKLNNILNDMIQESSLEYELTDLVVSEDLEFKIKRIIREYRKKELLYKSGLMNRSKVLITGEPGTGKTMTASVFAHELSLPLYIIQVDKMVNKFMGETSAKLRQIFDIINEVDGVYLFDEFDAIGSDRSLDNDVGEMRRVLNSFLQFIEKENPRSILLAATNNPKLLDAALFRRFDDVLEYKKPDRLQIERLLKMLLGGTIDSALFNETIYEKAYGLSHADIVNACENAIKYSVLEDKHIDQKIIIECLNERRNIYSYREA